MTSNTETGGSFFDTIKLLVALAVLVGAIIAFNLYQAEFATWIRVLGLLAAVGVGAAIAGQTAKGRNFFAFVRDANVEVRKVVWPTRQETFQTTLVIIVVVILVSIFLWLIDMFFGWGIRTLIG